MDWKDWLAGATFLLVVALAVMAIVLVIDHERHHRSTISQRREQAIQSLCVQNPGDGGC